jgi:hypothetical protein
MTPELRYALYKWDYAAGQNGRPYEDVEDCVPAQLQRLFVELQTSGERAVETLGLTKSFGWTSSDACDQQDAQELCKVLTDALEVKFEVRLTQLMFRGVKFEIYEPYRVTNSACSSRGPVSRA